MKPLLMDCPTCEGTTEVDGLVRTPATGLCPYRPFETRRGPVPCPDCRGEGVVPRPCVMHDIDGCEAPAVRWPEGAEPVCAEHDVCDACAEAWDGGGPAPAPPIPGERFCARHLADVAASEAA